MRILYLIIVVFLLNINSVFSQNYFTTIPFPDSLNVTAIAVNEYGDLFVTTSSQWPINDGVYRSLNDGTTWECVFDFGNVPSGKDVKINVNGEIYALANQALNPGNLIKSVDNGETWDNIFIPGSATNSLLFFQGEDTLLIAQDHGNGGLLLRSIDNGETWDTLFITQSHPSEQITDLVIDQDGYMYVSLKGYFNGQGGLFRSVDNGITWELFAFENGNVLELAINSAGDIFTTVGSNDDPSGLYMIHHEDQSITLQCPFVAFSGLVINSSDDLYLGDCYSAYRVYHSADNGYTYETLSSGLSGYPVWELFIDSEQYIYVIGEYTSWIGKSTEPTITGIKNVEFTEAKIYPNPADDMLNGILSFKSENGQFCYKIINTIGQIELSGNLNIKDGQFYINVSDISNGFHQLIINLNNKGFIRSAFLKK